jgi:GNAT superfamily N-acetyltransferase
VIEIWPSDRWDEVAPINALVYPPENPITAVWRAVQWASAEQRMIALQDGEPVSHVGLYIREGLAKGREVRIAGIGGVMTHPAHQGKGHAKRLLKLADEKARERNADFGLLVCEEKNIPFYESLGWRRFGGHMIHQQHGKSVNWTLSPMMVCDLAKAAPRGGMIDLRGMPW